MLVSFHKFAVGIKMNTGEFNGGVEKIRLYNHRIIKF